MKIEFREGSTGSIDPWTLERMISLGKNSIVTDDMASWARINENQTIRVLPDAESRIKSGEDPEKVIMDSLEFWRPRMIWRKKVFSHLIEVGIGMIDPKSWWKSVSKGLSTLTTNGPNKRWIYVDDCPPICIDERDYLNFMRDLGAVDTEEEFNELIHIWSVK